MSRSRNFALTINHPEPGDYLCFIDQRSRATYYIIGREVGEAGTPHLQCYIHFKSPTTIRGLKRHFPRAHIEECKGSPQQNIDYCKKQGRFEEWGTAPLSQEDKGELGKRTWEEVRTHAEAGEFQEIPAKIYITQFKNLMAVRARAFSSATDLEEPCGIWIHGPPGTGKTYTAKQLGTLYHKEATQWWDAYEGEEVVLIDDISPASCQGPMTDLLKKWTDRYCFAAQVKGGHLKSIRPKKVIITSNYTIEECFTNPVDAQAMKRRCKVYSKPTRATVINL